LIEPVFPSSFSASSKILSRPNVSDDFPLPVRPTIPIFSCRLIENEIYLMTVGKSGLY